MQSMFARPLSKWLLVCLLLGCVLVIVMWMLSADETQNNSQYDNLWIDNVTQLNPVRVAQVIAPTTTEEIITAITQTSGPVSIGGGRYSQGGQVAYPDSLHIDMRQLSKCWHSIKIKNKSQCRLVFAGAIFRTTLIRTIYRSKLCKPTPTLR